MMPKNKPSGERLLLIDISNSFSKIALAQNGILGRVQKIPTADLATTKFPTLRAARAVISSVVPKANQILEQYLKIPLLWVNHTTSGVCIRYPKPATIGADRLANTAAAVALGKLPAIVVDFGTAVTFDIIDVTGCYLGGIIAPGLATAASALHERTALLPLTKIQRITSPIGKSTQQAIQIGLLLGAVGIVREVVARIQREIFLHQSPVIIATGGDAKLVARLTEETGKKIIHIVDPLLTLRGLLVIAEKNRHFSSGNLRMLAREGA
jgi:type III pantothenate kinase